MRAAVFFLSLFGAGSALAQTLQCPEPPRQVANEVIGRVSVDFGFVGRLTGADIGGQVQSQAANLFASYPNADRIVVVQVMASMLCNLLRSSSLPDREKVDRFDQFFARVTAAAFPALPPVAVSPPVQAAPPKPTAPAWPDTAASQSLPAAAPPGPAQAQQLRTPLGSQPPAATPSPAAPLPAAAAPAPGLAPSRLVLDLARYQQFQMRNWLSQGQVSEALVIDLEGGPRLNFQLGPNRREQAFLVAVPAGLDSLKYRLTGVTTREVGGSRLIINHRAEGTVFPAQNGRFVVDLLPEALSGAGLDGSDQAKRSTAGTFLSPERCTEASWRRLMGARFAGRLLPSGRAVETSLYERNGRPWGTYTILADGVAGSVSGTLVVRWIASCRAAFQWRDRTSAGHLILDFTPEADRFAGFGWSGSDPEPDEAPASLVWDGRRVGAASSP